jgi:hypothetical protein
VRIRQYSYFGLFSQVMSSAEMTGELGIEPDEFRVRGSRVSDPPMPRVHSWRIVCRDSGTTVQDQITRVLERLLPHASALGELARHLREIEPDPPRAGSILAVVRHFGDEEGEAEVPSAVDLPNGNRLDKMPGQHQLLGWQLDSTVIEFLHSTGAELDVDEYG